MLYAETGSATALGIQGLCFSIPIAVVPLLAGPIADRIQPARLLKAMLAVEALTAVGLTVLAALGSLSPFAFYSAAVIDASRLAFTIPAQTRLTPALVPKHALLSAQALSVAVWPSSALVGPALGGLLLSTTSIPLVFAVNAATTLIGLAMIIPVKQQVAPSLEAKSRLGDGLRYIVQARWPLGLQLIMLCAATLTIGVETLLPAIAVTTFGAGPPGYAALRMAPGVSAVFASLILARLTSTPRQPLWAITGAMVLATAAALVFACTPRLSAAVGLLGVTGLALVATQILIGTELQQHIPAHYLGSIGGLNAISQSGLAGIGAATMAIAAQHHTPEAVITAAAVASALITVLAASFARTITRTTDSRR